MLRHMSPPSVESRTVILRESRHQATISAWSRRSAIRMSRLSWRSSATSSWTSRPSGTYWRTTVAKRKRHQNLTAEDRARHERIMEMVRERIAYHEAKAREQEEAAARERGRDS